MGFNAISLVGADGVFSENPGSIPWYKDPMLLREQIILELRKVIDPDLHKDIVSCNFIKNLKFDYDEGRVEFTLELTTPACPIKDQFVDQCIAFLKELDWILDVDITVSADQKPHFAGDSNTNLKGVRFIVPIASCKGGVGKSSLAVNIAFMFSKLGAKVGIVDIDIYGPSLNTLVPIPDVKVFFAPPEGDVQDPQGTLASGSGCLLPCEYAGVKMMSYSFLKPQSNAFAAVRGPLASSLTYQMVTQTKWGDLDYLFIDTPPGTGDIHLTLAQSVKLTGAIVVTTPQQLSLLDVEKGIHFFADLGVPTVALIENMAYIDCGSCKTSVEIFQSVMEMDSEECKNNGGAQRMVERFGVGLHAKLPLDRKLSAVEFRDKKTNTVKFPFALAFDEKDSLWRKLRDICTNLARELSSSVFSDDKRVPEVGTTSDGYIQMVDMGRNGEDILTVPMTAVRRSCGCADCVDQLTGKPKMNRRVVPLDIYAKKMEQATNYAVRIAWSDGHISLISFAKLRELSRIARGATRGANCTDISLNW